MQFDIPSGMHKEYPPIKFNHERGYPVSLAYLEPKIYLLYSSNDSTILTIIDATTMKKDQEISMKGKGIYSIVNVDK